MAQKQEYPRVYGVEAFAYFFVLVTVLFTIVGLVAVLPDAVRHPENAPFDIVWFGIVLWFWFNILRSPYRVTLYEDRLEIRSLARRLTIPTSDLTEIRGLPVRIGMILRSTRHKVWFRAAPKEAFDLLTRLRSINSQIQISGV